MAELSTLARPYAKAAFEYALASGDLSGWEKQLANAAAVAGQNKIKNLLTAPALTSEQQVAQFIAVCGDSVSGKVQNFLHVLAEHKRLPLLPSIHQLFAELKANQEKSVDVQVITAFAVDDATQNKLVAALKKRLQRDVRVNAVVDKTLLGGAVIRAGDLVIDGSVRGRLAKLAESLHG